MIIVSAFCFFPYLLSDTPEEFVNGERVKKFADFNFTQVLRIVYLLCAVFCLMFVGCRWSKTR